MKTSATTRGNMPGIITASMGRNSPKRFIESIEFVVIVL